MKKFVLALVCVTFIGLGYSSFNTTKAGIGVECKCTRITGDCRANGASSSQCAPDGTAKCWDFDRNCNAM